jgi:outer membrane lipoprotein SlyB
MKKFVLATLVLSACGSALAQAPSASERAKAAVALARCDTCGTVQGVHQEKRKGEGGAVGIVGGAVAGGLLGNQVGKGTGKTVATVGGAVAGGFVGNEVQKHVTSKTVWVTKVKMKDGSIKTFEQEAKPGWAAGQTVKVRDKTLAKL